MNKDFGMTTGVPLGLPKVDSLIEEILIMVAKANMGVVMISPGVINYIMTRLPYLFKTDLHHYFMMIQHRVKVF